MSNDENKCDKIQPNTTTKHKNVQSIENVVTPEVKILNRGDLLGAINCLFPELQLKSAHIKLKEKFSLFSYSLHELTSIFESGRKYRSRTGRNTKCSTANQSMRPFRADTGRINFKRTTVTTENMVSVSKAWKSKGQKKQHSYETEPRKRCDTVSFQSSYNDFVTKFLESHYPDRFVDFKNIECVILELDNLLKEMSKESKIGPFNPNLPVLNISECDKVVRINSGSKDILKAKTSASIKRICHKRKSRSRTHVEAKARRKKSTKKRRSTRQIEIKLPNDSDDENGGEIERNIENLLRDDTFSPRYKAKHTSDMFVIFRKPQNRHDTTIFTALEQEAIEQYENVDDDLKMNFNLLAIEARPK